MLKYKKAFSLNVFIFIGPRNCIYKYLNLNFFITVSTDTFLLLLVSHVVFITALTFFHSEPKNQFNTI